LLDQDVLIIRVLTVNQPYCICDICSCGSELSDGKAFRFANRWR